MTSTHDLLGAWRHNNRINLRLIDGITAAGMSCTMSKHGGRDVAGQLIHLHNVRCTWLSLAGPRWATGVRKLRKETMPTKARLKAAHTASTAAIERWLAAAIDDGLKLKNFAGGPFQALGYFLSHDAHHRGAILLTLKLCCQKVDDEVRYALWGSWHNKKQIID